jgi:hypothetical protein
MLYLGAGRSTPLIQDILKAKPRRIILNPSAENEKLAKAASSAGNETVEGCSRICAMNQTGRDESDDAATPKPNYFWKSSHRITESKKW